LLKSSPPSSSDLNTPSSLPGTRREATVDEVLSRTSSTPSVTSTTTAEREPAKSSYVPEWAASSSIAPLRVIFLASQ
jgi:hypothetical protein